MPKVFIPFGEFAPDSRERDDFSLEEAKNVLPVFGSYRSLQGPHTVSRATTSYPVTGSIVHLVTESAVSQKGKPTADSVVDDYWYALDETQTSLYEDVNEGRPDDADYLLYRNTTAAQYNVDFDIDSLTDPVSATEHYLRMRYRLARVNNTAYTLTCSLLEGGTIVDPAADPVTITVTGGTPDSDEWSEEELTLSAAQANAITDYTDLGIRVEAQDSDVSGLVDYNPVSDVENPGNFTPSTGSDLYAVIDSLGADNAASPELLEDQAASFTVALDSGIPNPVNNVNHEVHYTVNADASGVDALVELLEEREEGDVVIASYTDTDIQVSPLTVDAYFTLTGDEADSIEDYSALRLRFTLTNTTPGGSTQYARPDSQSSNGGWKNQAGSTSNIWQAIDEAALDTSDYIDGLSDDTVRSVIFPLSNISAPSDHSGTKLNFVAKANDGTGKVRAEFHDGTGKLKSKTFWVQANRETFTIDLSGVSASVDDWDDIKIKFEKRTPNGSWQPYIYQAWVEVAASSNVGYVHDCFMRMDDLVAVDISWLQFECPAKTTNTLGDQSMVFCGTED